MVIERLKSFHSIEIGTIFTHSRDYSSSELKGFSAYRNFNVITAFLDFFAIFGLVYDQKTVSQEMIASRVQRTGDGSHWSSS